jgi:transcriptional regulator with XRE-family HTH domain
MTQTSLAERLRILRAQKGLSVAQASEKIGVARHTLRDLELGRREPHYPTLSKIAKGYSIPVEELLEEPAVPLGEAEERRAWHKFSVLANNAAVRWGALLKKLKVLPEDEEYPVEDIGALAANWAALDAFYEHLARVFQPTEEAASAKKRIDMVKRSIGELLRERRAGASEASEASREKALKELDPQAA